ncbi:NAD-dependent epimerase/dehydratase family protein [Solimonas marina]|uniref:NAD(P)H-binding protein n=1 Tax=Solimonas marina TaxID=2714601 RepID=A0A970B8E6_9GAMM|nr:NAD(P)H-binding protein [Solimonas marina]NKF21306.1 NAD(P)H-binding protein [Solimonas marina]
MKRIALVAGATGLVGHQVVARLLRDPAYTEVRVLTRRPFDLEDPHLTVVRTDFADLATLQALGDALAVSDVYCCLGTTIKRAGCRAAFADVDERMVVDLARATLDAGAQQFLVISAVGASDHALAFYSRVKGRMEKAVAALGFDAVHVLRPSLLLGERDEHRAGEAFAQQCAPLAERMLRGPLRRYRPVDADEVAEGMLRVALRGERGVHVHHFPLDELVPEGEADSE